MPSCLLLRVLTQRFFAGFLITKSPAEQTNSVIFSATAPRRNANGFNGLTLCNRLHHLQRSIPQFCPDHHSAKISYAINGHRKLEITEPERAFKPWSDRVAVNTVDKHVVGCVVSAETVGPQIGWCNAVRRTVRIKGFFFDQIVRETLRRIHHAGIVQFESLKADALVCETDLSRLRRSTRRSATRQ